MANSLLARAKAAYSVFFGPLDPLPPMAPPETAGRQFDYRPGYNLTSRPRGDDLIGFDRLRHLADSYDLMRLVIETRKDQLAKLVWAIQPRDPTSAAKSDARIGAATAFLAAPDREHDWATWLRILVEDMLVIDAACLYPRQDQGGGLYSLDIIDGATIKRVLDDYGRTPAPPDAAYQQVLKGLAATNYTREQLLYLPRNPRSNRVYGFSPVEQVVMTVDIAMRRQLHQLQYYTEGNIPEALIGMPETWTPDQIGQFQAYWDALLEGNTGQRRHAKFVPATISKSFIQTKEAALKDEYDEWLARLICYAFNVANQPFVKQTNRATAETAQEQTIQEGLAPLQAWVKGIIDRVLRDCFGWPDLEFTWTDDVSIDPLQQAQINDIYLKNGTLCINDVRVDLGKTPNPSGNELLVYTATGPVRLADAIKPPEPPPTPTLGHNGGPALDGEDDAADDDAVPPAPPMAKAARAVDHDRPFVRTRRTAAWRDFLAAQAQRTAATVGGLWRPLAKAQRPDAPPPPTPATRAMRRHLPQRRTPAPG